MNSSPSNSSPSNRSSPAAKPCSCRVKRRNSVYNITQGVARLYKLLPDGRRQIVGFALPGDFLGLAMRERYGFSADAIEPIVACRFARPPIRPLSTISRTSCADCTSSPLTN